MNDINLYEKIPHEQFPIRILLFKHYAYHFPAHWHEHTEIHFLLRGHGKLRCGENILQLKIGDCAIIGENELHAGLGGDIDYICLIIPPDFFEGNHSIFEHVVRDAYVAKLINNIYQSYTNHSNTYMLEIKGNMYFLISHLIKNYSTKTLEESLYSGYVNKLNKVNEAIDYLGNNYDKHLTTRDLSDHVHLSEGYFCRIFKEITGKTAMEYLNELRIEKAHEMLKSTELTVTEIALCCGFTDSNYFSRTYKKYKGVTPLTTKAEKD